MRCVLTLGLVPILIVRPSHGGAVIFHEHVSHELHAHTVSPSQLEDWCDEHHHWHTTPQDDDHGSLEVFVPHDHSLGVSLDGAYGGIVIFHHPFLARQNARHVLPEDRCSVAAFGMFFGVPPGQSIERQCLVDESFQRCPVWSSATTALLLRSHALLI